MNANQILLKKKRGMQTLKTFYTVNKTVENVERGKKFAKTSTSLDVFPLR